MPPGPNDPLAASRFSIVIDGIELAAFSELVGLETEVEPEAMTLSSPEQNVGRTPGIRKLPSVTLKRGLTGGMELFAWHQSVREGNMAAARKDASLLMFSTDGQAVAKFALLKAWPSKLSITTLKAGSSELLFESVTIVCESLQRASPT